MRWSIRSQIMFPVALLVLTVALTTSFLSAYFAAQQSDVDSFRQLQAILSTLEQSRFPLTEPVLQKMKGLAGAEFIAIPHDGKEVLSTSNLEPGLIQSLRFHSYPTQIRQISQLPMASIGKRRHFVARVPGISTKDELYVLYPEGRLLEAQWNAVGLPLIAGVAAAIIGVLMSIMIAYRLARHVQTVHEQLAQIGTRHFLQVEPTAPVEELYNLQVAANRLSQRLKDLEQEIVRSERMRLLAQLAGGIAHHLRNALTGARLALQIHQKRCGTNKQDESLAVAERELCFMEEHIKSLLTLGVRQDVQRPGYLADIVGEVERLMRPLATHREVEWVTDLKIPERTGAISDASAVRAALVNLVSNAIEAAGPKGTVALRTKQVSNEFSVEVEDSGPGPTPEVAVTLFDPFVTTKSEGVGLGLCLAREAAEGTGGVISWSRHNDKTVFCLRWPDLISSSFAK